MSETVRLKIAIADHPHTQAIKDGSIPIAGVDAEFVTVKPQIGAFRRMVRDLEFDVCELAPTTYIIARSFGAPFVALPIFVGRRFHHAGLLVRPGSGIVSPKDLEGKRVGVRAYSVTTGVWLRQVLIDEFGVDTSRVTWVVDDEEHVKQLTLPGNVVHAPPGRSLADMMASGELDAGLAGAAGIGRTGAPTGGWQEVDTSIYPDLLPDAEALEAAYFRRTGIYPMHGTIVVKGEVLEEHPWVARSLFDAFDRAKSEWLAGLVHQQSLTGSDKRYEQLRAIVGSDPLPYGIEVNRKSIEALEETAHKQGLTAKRMSMDELFVDPADTEPLRAGADA